MPSAGCSRKLSCAARVPYTIVGDVGFYQRAEIKDALALLRLVVAPDDRQSDESFRRVINTPARGFGAKAMTILEQEAAWRRVSLLAGAGDGPASSEGPSGGLSSRTPSAMSRRQAAATVADQLSLVLDATGYRKMLRDSQAETMEGRLDNVQELIQLAGGFHSGRELLDHAALATGAPGEDMTNTVKLLTLHRAKGLEFPHVFLVAWENGLMPPLYGDHNEERRLAYVGVTRGMKRVTISHASFRRGPATPSSFLEDIPEINRVEGWHEQQPSGARPSALYPSRDDSRPKSAGAPTHAGPIPGTVAEYELRRCAICGPATRLRLRAAAHPARSELWACLAHRMELPGSAVRKPRRHCKSFGRPCFGRKTGVFSKKEYKTPWTTL